MALYGYARVSTIDQDLSLQQRALRDAGCRVVRAEKASGTFIIHQMPRFAAMCSVPFLH